MILTTSPHYYEKCCSCGSFWQCKAGECQHIQPNLKDSYLCGEGCSSSQTICLAGRWVNAHAMGRYVQWWPCRLHLIWHWRTQALQILKTEKISNPDHVGNQTKKKLKPPLGPWWRATRKHLSSHGFCVMAGFSVEERPFPVVGVFLLFLSNMIIWTQCSYHRITGALILALYPILSRNFISWAFPRCFQLGCSWPAGTQVFRWEIWQTEAWWSHKLFFLSKIGQKDVYLHIPISIQNWLRWRAHLFPEHQETLE